jgi:hypothetical protein
MSATNPDDVCQMAQNLARNCGYYVFPVLETKHPATPHGFQNASSNADAIAELWRRYPAPLIGIATGEVSGIDVLDIDFIKHPIALRWWDAASKRIPPTRTYGTRSGGYHAYFRHSDGISNTQSKLAHGVDSRGGGGYAIYWFAAPALWPNWLRDCLLWQPPKVVLPAVVISPRHADKAISGIIRHVAAAREGERNRSLFWGACRLGERVEAGQIGQGEATALLVNSARAIGLQDIEAQRTVASAWKAA